MTVGRILSISHRLLYKPLSVTFYQGIRICRDESDVRKYVKDVFFPHDSEFSQHWNNVLFANEDLEKRGICITYPTAKDYPKMLYELSRPPVFLSYRGHACWEETALISVVGSRQPTDEALQWMDIYLKDIVAQGVGVVSGAARGVDQRAHRISIMAQSPTVAFLPSGLDRIYPSGFRCWIDSVRDVGGAVVSEYMPDSEMRKHYFHERNRLICRMGRLLLVVQARARSGSLMTAQHAIEQGQPVGAVPWGPMSIEGVGTNQLLADGATLVKDDLDLKTAWERAMASVPYTFDGIDTHSKKDNGDPPD